MKKTPLCKTVTGNLRGGVAERRAQRRCFHWFSGFVSLTGRRSSGGGAGFGATVMAARTAFDEITLQLFISAHAMRAADAVAPNLPPPADGRGPVRKTMALYPWKYRRCRRGAPPCRHADCRFSGVFFVIL